MSGDDKLQQMQDITYRKVQTMFFDHTRKVIFEEHELRSLQSLLRDYCSIISQFGFPTSGVRSSYIKEILRREFKGRIAFTPVQKGTTVNLSMMWPESNQLTMPWQVEIKANGSTQIVVQNG